MGSKVERLTIDYDKLRACLLEKGIQPGDASVKLGHSMSFLARGNSAGSYSLPTVIAIESVFGIPYDAYKRDEPKPVPEHVEAQEDFTAVSSVSDDIVKAIDSLTETVSAQNELIKAMANALDRIIAKAESLDAPALYKAIFVPTYNAVRAAWVDSSKKAEYHDVQRKA